MSLLHNQMKRSALLKLIACMVFIGVCYYSWSALRVKRQMDDLLERAGSCNDVHQVIAFMGQPYAVYDQMAPKVGSELVGPNEDLSRLVTYAFTVTKMPPTFLVVVVNREDGKIIRVGSAKS